MHHSRILIEYNILGYEVSLRKSEAGLIEVSMNGNGGVRNDFNGVLQIEQSLNLAPVKKSKVINVALVGNPNSGKTTLFNLSSHSKEKVGNYGGITVDAKKAKFKHKGYTFNLVDLPGTYSITSYTPEELYVRDHLINELPDVILNVVDASNLERNLYLTTQLIDLDRKIVIALNMWDEFEEKGDVFDYKALGKMIGIPMVPTVSSKNQGIHELFDKIIDVYEDQDPTVRHIHINYGFRIEKSIRVLQELISKEGNEKTDQQSSPAIHCIEINGTGPGRIEKNFKMPECSGNNQSS